MADITWTNEKRRLADLVPWGRNPRQIKKAEGARLAESLDTFGQIHPIAIGPDDEIYDGHQRQLVWSALDRCGPNFEVDVRVSSRALTEKEREQLVVFLHRGTVAEWDWDVLANEFEVGDLLEWGFSDAELGLAGLDLSGDEPLADPGAQVDRADELREKWGTAAGQLWELGQHRLVCGDCTDGAIVTAVMGASYASLVVTDPPYGVGYADKNRFLNTIGRGNRIQEPIRGDHGEKIDIQDLWKRAFCEMEKVMLPGAVVYCFMPQGGDQMMMMMMMMMGAGIEPRHELIWLKNNHVLGRVDYAYKHEPILYAWKDGGHKFFGDFQTSVLEFPKPQSSKLHPTTKPLELIEHLIGNSSRAEEIVFDPFIGSGTTLIACERLGRRCRGIEIEPKYVAVTLERWHEMTGEQPQIIDRL